MNPSQKGIIEDIIRRFKDELRDAYFKVTTLKVELMEEEEISTMAKVKKFMENSTEMTEKETDVIGTTELWYKYEEWNRNKNKEDGLTGMDIGAVNVVLSTNEMGRILSELNYKSN